VALLWRYQGMASVKGATPYSLGRFPPDRESNRVASDQHISGKRSSGDAAPDRIDQIGRRPVTRGKRSSGDRESVTRGERFCCVRALVESTQ